MRVAMTKSKSSTTLTIIKSIRVDGKNTSKVVERLGSIEEIMEREGVDDALSWAKEYAKELTEKEKREQAPVQLKFSQTKQIDAETQRSFNVGYLFLQQLYGALGLPKICEKISQRHAFKYDLNAILSRLVFSQILFPGSKSSTFRQAQKFIEKPGFELHQIYRALEVLFAENDLIQSSIYKNRIAKKRHNNKVLYYDCTNFYFEIEQADVENEEGEKGLRQYGHSKENRPNPIVQLGLFMDGDGVPLAFDITPGNTNEQTTLQPLEKKIFRDFGTSKFVVCTDAGLSSMANRKFNDRPQRKFITTQSIKKLKKALKEWALSEDDWFLPVTLPDGKIEHVGPYTLAQIKEEDNPQKTYYKERWINEDKLSQRIVVSFSTKYQHYQEKIRAGQIERAEKIIKAGSTIPKKVNANDPRRLVKQQTCTTDGEIATVNVLSLNYEQIAKEAQYDGFYAVCTNLKDEVSEIIAINRGRWEIEESFRIMKSEFKARPVHLSVTERIRAHFLVCFLALTIYRLLEKKIPGHTCGELLETLREMNMLEIRGEGFIPTYTRTQITDDLHKKAGFHTDFEIVSTKNMKKILKASKS
jgi:transposase